ncbi:F-box domain-containing protein [Stagonosporopsis vannaccii]|nr:F-box domain-containing protein [Stagonosporopsis vannaccii]
MPRYAGDSDGDEPLEDKTAALSLKSKRTQRMQRRKIVRDQKKDAVISIAMLPTELLLECLLHLVPRDVFNFSLINRRCHALVAAHACVVGHTIIERRYTLLAQCFPTPKLLRDVEPAVQELLTDSTRQTQLSIHKRPYQHIQPPDAGELCTCLTCILAWNNLGLVLDFAHWQPNLDNGVPIPVIPRGQPTVWNSELVARNARIARKAVEDPLWHALILEMHLDSTVRSIRRHSQNKGNKRAHVDMSDEEVAVGTDTFLSKQGPPSLEFPYQRDEYYMLEAYLPNRWWKKAEKRWVYIMAGQHDNDLKLVQHFAKR